MTPSIRYILLLVAGACLLSAVGYGGEDAAPAPTAAPQVAKIVTSDGRMLVGEVLADTKDGVRILDLRSGAEVTVAVDTIKVRENALAAQEAIKWVGLSSYLAWRVKKESELNPKGKIITVTPTTIYLSLGQRDGVEKGDKVNVYRESETLSDPDTGEVLGKVRARIGELEVIEVQEKFSKAKRLSDLEVEFKAGDVAESAKTKKAVAVFPIVPARDDQLELAMLVTERLTTELASRGVPLVERALITHALIEMGIQTSALVDQDKAVKLGQLIGAQAILTGTLGSVEPGRVEVHARLVKVSTGEVLVAGSEVLHVDIPKKDVAPAASTAVVAQQDVVTEGVGWGAAHIGATKAEVLAAFGTPDDKADVWLNYRKRLGMDVFFGTNDKAREVRFNPGFRHTLSSGVGIGSTMQSVFDAYGQPTRTESVPSSRQDLFEDKVLYRKPGGAKISYNDKGVLFWFDSSDRVSQFVVFGS